MKKVVLIGVLLIMATGAVRNVFGQNAKGFETIILNDISPLKDQQSSGTCWSFAVTSFIESEALRLGKDTVILSPIFYVKPAYIGKAGRYIDTKGKSYFEPGDLSFSVMDAYMKYGAIPEDAYTGLPEGDWQHDHIEMDNLLSEMVESVGKSGYGRIKPNSWEGAIAGTLDAYLGTAPQSFEYKGEKHTPKSFADKYVGINPEEYVEITSYSQCPFYQSCILDIPANWNDNQYLNLPIQDFEVAINTALEQGYTLAWDGDASTRTFKFDQGFAKLSKGKEKQMITQQVRQRAFDSKSTTDDHNMHIVGMAKDEDGKLFYIMKNSEGDNELGGYIYMSKNALLLKTISVMLHESALSKEIQEKAEAFFVR